MSKIFAITRGQIVENVVVSEAPLVSEGEVWVEVTDMVPRPDTAWKYVNSQFVAPDSFSITPTISTTPTIETVDPPPPPKTEEEKIADATAAAITKLIADGVLKPG
jgi:hypothetical protein